MMARWQEQLMPVCQKQEMTYVAFSPMTNGALTGVYQLKNDFGNSKQDFRINMLQCSDEGIKKQIIY